jgi:hypothetical protein
MRIVDRQAFLLMSEGTVFSKYAPCYFRELMVKGETRSSDFMYQPITDAIDANSSADYADKLDQAYSHGISIAMDLDCQSRDGLFEEDQMFAVWERSDVEQLIARLHRALVDGYEHQEDAQ